MAQQVYLRLQHSESVVADCAAKIYAAHVSRGGVRQGSEQEMMRTAVSEAIQICQLAEQAVRSEDEKERNIRG